jgi:hypothetical protein
MTTAMAQSEVIASSQLSSSIIENENTSTNPNNDNESSDAVTASAPTNTTTIAKNNLHGSTGSSSGVSFGSVHVHQHRMTLGVNPEVRHGVPVELAWEVEQSCVFDTVDEFEETVHATSTTDETSLLKNQGSSADPTSTTTTSSTVPHPVKRMTAAEREEIASVHHSRDSIVRVQSDMHTIQQHRHDSQRDPAAKMVVMKLEQQPHAVVMPIGSSSSRSSNQAGPHVPRSKRWMLLCCGCCTNQQLQQ